MKQISQITSSSDDVPIPSKTNTRKNRLLLSLCLATILFIPSLLTSPEPVTAIEALPSPLAVEYHNIFQPHIPNSWDPLLVTILENEAGVHNIRDPEWPARVDTFIEMVKIIESEGKREAYNPSGAMSYFQFKGPSLETAYNRLVNYVSRYDLGRTTPWSKYLAENPTSIYQTPESRQAVFVVVNIIEQDRSRDLWERFMSGEEELAKELYYRYHHTAPDSFTKKRTERIYKQHFN